MTPFALNNVQDKSSVTVVVDSEVLASDKHLAFRNFAADSSLFVQPSQLKAFLEKVGVTYTELKLAELATAAPAPKSDAPKQAPKAKTEVAAADDGEQTCNPVSRLCK